MSPAVGGELPAVVPETLCHLADRLFIGFIIWVRTLIGRIRPVSQNALISGKRQDRPGTPVGKIGVFRDKVLKERHEIIRAHRHGAVIHHHLAGRLSVLTHDHPACETITVHILVIAEVILGHDERNLSGRQHNISRHHLRIAVFVRHLVGNIVELYENISFLVHGIQDL